jgi:hypothetical protein
VLVVLALRPLLRYRVIVDAHNEAVGPVVHPGPIVRRVARRLLAAADFTIVTNSALAAVVREAGGRPLELVDPLPDVPEGTAQYEDSPNVVVIATFAPDEPLDQIVAAAASPRCRSLQFLVTGRPPANWVSRTLPANVRLSGFMPEEAYWSALARAAVIVDVTTMPSCVVCGAYEAVAVARPIVLANDSVNVEIFGAAAVYVDASAESIAAGIAEAYGRRDEIVASVPGARASLDERWRRGASRLLAALGLDSSSATVLDTAPESRG